MTDFDNHPKPAKSRPQNDCGKSGADKLDVEKKTAPPSHSLDSRIASGVPSRRQTYLHRAVSIHHFPPTCSTLAFMRFAGLLWAKTTRYRSPEGKSVTPKNQGRKRQGSAFCGLSLGKTPTKQQHTCLEAVQRLGFRTQIPKSVRKKRVGMHANTKICRSALPIP